MKNQPKKPSTSGFTLMETVIAIGVIALLVTGFVAVFTPAVDGIRRAISAEEADRLTSTLERELVNLRTGQEPVAATTGFEKAFDWILNSDEADERLMVYQYRGQLNSTRPDNTPIPVPGASGVPGRDYVTVPMLRSISDPLLVEDLAALEGRIYLVRCTQLVYDADGALQRGVAGTIRDPKPGGIEAATANAYPEAVLPFAAEFFSVPTKDLDFIRGYSLANRKPMFTRNLAVRR